MSGDAFDLNNAYKSKSLLMLINLGRCMQLNLGFTVNFRKQQDAVNTLNSFLSSRRSSFKRLSGSSEFLLTGIFWLLLNVENGCY